MKNKVLTIILLFCASILFAQTITPKKCNTCGKPLAQCQYKGKHPSTTKEKGQSMTSGVSAPTGTYNGYGWVDLGLPSGTRWAKMNVGASSPSDYGSYFAWGETSPKSSYTWENLRYCLDTTGDKFSKYVTDSKYGEEDGKQELELSDDAAFVNWGNGWRMPSISQQEELLKICKWTWIKMSGHNGYKVVGPNGKSIFLPAAGAGYWSGIRSSSLGQGGVYWSRSLSLGMNCNASILDFTSRKLSWGYYYLRCCGHSIRAVRVLE